MARNRKVISGVIGSSVAISAFVIFTKVVGFFKQAVIAAQFGATTETDAFFLASGFVASFGTMIFSSLSVTLLSMYVREKEKGAANANQLVTSTLRLFVPLSVGLSLLLFVFSDSVAFILAPAYDGETLAVVSHYLKLLSAVVFLYCPYLVLNAVLEANKVFLAGRVLGLLQSAFLIGAAIVPFAAGDIIWLIAAFLLASVINLVYIAFRAIGYYRPTRKAPVWSAQMGTLVKLMIPVLLGNAVLEVNSIVEKAVASSLGAGSVSALTYGWSIYEIVTGVIISALSTVLFSYFAGYLAKGDVRGMTTCLDKCLSSLSLILIPTTIVTVLCAGDIVSVLYSRGSFDESARQATSLVVSTYALGFVPTAIRSVLAKAHYAFQDSRTPMYNGVVTVALGAIGSLALAFAAGFGIAGIGIAVSLSMCVSAILYQFSLSKKIASYGFGEKTFKFWGKCLVAGAVSTAAGTATLRVLYIVGPRDSLAMLALGVVAVASVIFISFFAASWALRTEELGYLMSSFFDRVGHKEIG